MNWNKNREQLKQDRQELESWWLKQNITPRRSKSGKGYYITYWNVYRYETNYHDLNNDDQPLPTILKEDIEDMSSEEVCNREFGNTTISVDDWNGNADIVIKKRIENIELTKAARQKWWEENKDEQ